MSSIRVRRIEAGFAAGSFRRVIVDVEFYVGTGTFIWEEEFELDGAFHAERCLSVCQRAVLNGEAAARAHERANEGFASGWGSSRG